MKGCESVKLTYTDINYKLHKESLVEFDTCPVGGHNYNKKVETRICQIIEPFQKNSQNERLSVLQWETLSSVIGNTIICDYENMDLNNTKLTSIRKKQ